MDTSVPKRLGTPNHYRRNELEKVRFRRKKSIVEAKRPEKERHTKSFVILRSDFKNTSKEKPRNFSKNAENKKPHHKSILKVKPVVKLPKNDKSQSKRPSILKNIDNERNPRNRKIIPRTDPSKHITMKVFENEPDPSQSRRSSILKTNNVKSPSQLKSILKLPDQENTSSRHKSILKVPEKDKPSSRHRSKLKVPEKEKSLRRHRSSLNRSNMVNRAPFGSKRGRSLQTHKSALRSKSLLQPKNITTFLKQGIAVPPNLTKTANRVENLPRVSRKQKKLKEAVAKAQANGRYDLLGSLPKYGVPGMSLSDFVLMLDQASPIPSRLKTELPAELAREIFLKRVADTRKERAKKLEMLIRQNPETAKKILEKVDRAAGIARSKVSASKSNDVEMSAFEQDASNAKPDQKSTLNPDRTRKANAKNPKDTKKEQKDKDKKIEDKDRRKEFNDKKIEDKERRKVVKDKKIEDTDAAYSNAVKNSKMAASLMMNIFGRSKKREVVESPHAMKNDSIGKIKKISDDHEKRKNISDDNENRKKISDDHEKRKKMSDSHEKISDDLGKKKKINDALGYKKIENLGKMKSDNPGKTKRPGDDLETMAADRAAPNRGRK